MKTTQFTIQKHEAGQPLIQVLSRHLDLSHKKTKRILDSRSVFVNGQRIWMARHQVKLRDQISVTGPAPSIRKRPPAIPILYEDDDYLVVDKPSGLLSNEDDSVEALLRKSLQLPDLQAAHRIDRDTSGCLLLARHPEAFSASLLLFRRRSVKKQYHAIVSGRFTQDERKVTRRLEGKKAVTRIRCLDSCRRGSHLLLNIETGRTHQIRKHLDGIGFPILGDRHYGRSPTKDPALMAIGRQMLHAAKLGFKHPFSGRPVHVKAPLPADFRRCLKSLGLT